MADDLKNYLEGKKAAAERAKKATDPQNQLREDFARNASAKLKSLLPIANQISDDLSGSAVLGVGLVEMNGLVDSLTLKLTADDKTIDYALKVHGLAIHIREGVPSPVTRANITMPNINLVFVSAIELAEVNDNLLENIIQRMIDRIYVR